METTRTGRELHHFLLLGREQQQSAILRLAACGYTDYGIASATRLSVEQVRQILGAQAPTLIALGRRAGGEIGAPCLPRGPCAQ